MAGIDSLVNSRADMFAANPQGLQQRYAMNQDLLDLLALQKLKKDKEAAQRSLQMQMQPESGTVKDQLEGQMMQATKQEVAASLAPGLQQQGQMMQAQQMQQAMSGGVASQPAPNMVGMARGGIVGYAPGGDVEGLTAIAQSILANKPTATRPTFESVAERRARLEAELTSSREAKAQEQAQRNALVAAGLRGPEVTQALELFRQQEENAASMLGEGVERTPPRLLPLSEETPLPSDEAQYAELMQSPPGRTPESDAAGYVGLMQRDKPRATEASAGLPSLVPQRVIDDPENEANVAMATETLPAMQRAQREAPQDPRMSRYEAQLARLEAEETDKLGALVAFLQGAGASGGTNLGATLMGGGSGIQARDARIRDEMTQTVKNIEDLQFQRDEMQARRDETAEDRALRLQLEQMGIASAEKRSAAEIAARASEGAAERSLRASEFQQNLTLARNKFDEDVRQFGEELALSNREAAARELANDLTASLREDTLDRNLSNDERKELFDKVKVLNSTIETLALTDPEAAAPYRAELNRVYAGLGIDVGAAGTDEDPEIEALAAQYNTPVAR
jgi:hypothetical protein